MKKLFPFIFGAFVLAALWMKWSGDRQMEVERARAEAERMRKEEEQLLASKRGAMRGASDASTLDAATAARLKRDLRAVEPAPRREAAERLLRGGDPDALQILTKMLLKDPETANRVRAAQLLVDVKDRRALSALAASLSDPEPEVRSSAIQGLATAGDAAVMSHISRKLGDDEASVRLEAVRGLDNLRTRIADMRLQAELEKRKQAARKAGE